MYRYEKMQGILGSGRRHRKNQMKDLDFTRNIIKKKKKNIVKDIFRRAFFLTLIKRSTSLFFRRAQKYRKVYKEEYDYL